MPVDPELAGTGAAPTGAGGAVGSAIGNGVAVATNGAGAGGGTDATTNGTGELALPRAGVGTATTTGGGGAELQPHPEELVLEAPPALAVFTTASALERAAAALTPERRFRQNSQAARAASPRMSQSRRSTAYSAPWPSGLSTSRLPPLRPGGRGRKSSSSASASAFAFSAAARSFALARR